MSILRIEGGHRLSGCVSVHGAKNSALPILSASLLAEREVTIHNCPSLSDTRAAVRILEHLGCKVSWENDTVTVDPTSMNSYSIPHELMREMRSSVIFLGAILSRCGKAVLSLPGGCELGPRPIDLHLSALRMLGAEIDDSGADIICTASKLTGINIDFRFPSVGATENAMLAATGCEGKTVIRNAAREPEIWDLQMFLRDIGFNVNGAGTSVITVEGRLNNASFEHSVISDRIVAATFLSACASAGGDIMLKNVIPQHFSTVTEALLKMGCKVSLDGSSIRLISNGDLTSCGTVITEPYPGFPTDAQSPLMAVAIKAGGVSIFEENIFESRFKHIPELLKFGADIAVEGKRAAVRGVKRTFGASVASTDLRGGAAMVVAGLGAEGITEVSDIHHIDRGYENFEEMLTALGARIVRSQPKEARVS